MEVPTLTCCIIYESCDYRNMLDGSRYQMHCQVHSTTDLATVTLLVTDLFQVKRDLSSDGSLSQGTTMTLLSYSRKDESPQMTSSLSEMLPTGTYMKMFIFVIVGNVRWISRCKTAFMTTYFCSNSLIPQLQIPEEETLNKFQVHFSQNTQYNSI